jgi:Domain of unknown function (DUF1707)
MMTRYDVRTGMMEQDPDVRPDEQLVPGWRVPSHSRYDYDLRIGDAERDAATAQLRDHFVAGRLTFEELTERIDLALTAKTQRHIDDLMADLPRPPRLARAGSAPPVHDQDAGRFLVFALLLFAMATWVLIMAWMSRHAYAGPYPGPFGPGGPIRMHP